MSQKTQGKRTYLRCISSFNECDASVYCTAQSLLRHPRPTRIFDKRGGKKQPKNAVRQRHSSHGLRLSGEGSRTGSKLKLGGIFKLASPVIALLAGFLLASAEKKNKKKTITHFCKSPSGGNDDAVDAMQANACGVFTQTAAFTLQVFTLQSA